MSHVVNDFSLEDYLIILRCKVAKFIEFFLFGELHFGPGMVYYYLILKKICLVLGLGYFSVLHYPFKYSALRC